MLYRRKAKFATASVERLTDAGLIEQHAQTRSLLQREMRGASRSRRWLTVLAVTEGAVILGLTYSLVQVTPAIRLVPMMVNVRADGTAHAEPIMSMMPPDVSDATLRATLWQYVLWREGYSFDTAQFRRNIVVELSDRDVGEAYSEWYNYPNPDSPQVKYGRRGSVTIDQDSATFTSDPSVYQVNYWRTIKMDGQPAVRSHWTVFVHYRLVSAIPLRDRIDFNPAAVKIVAYGPPFQIDAPPTGKLVSP